MRAGFLAASLPEVVDLPRSRSARTPWVSHLQPRSAEDADESNDREFTPSLQALAEELKTNNVNLSMERVCHSLHFLQSQRPGCEVV